MKNNQTRGMTCRALLLGSLAVASGMLPTGAIAQELSLIDSARAAGVLSLPLATDAPLDTVVVVSGTRAELSVGEDGSEATISYGNLEVQNWQVQLKAPLDESSHEATFANLDGLSNSTRVSFDWRVFGGPRSGDSKVEERCENTGQGRALAQRLATSGEVSSLCTTQYRDLLERADSPKGRREFYSTLLGLDAAGAATAPTADPAWMRMMSLKVSGGFGSYEFIDSTTAESANVRKATGAIEAGVAWFKLDRALFALGARYEEAFKENDEGTICPPSAGDTAVACATGAVGPPVAGNPTVAYAELKWAPRRQDGTPRGFAISPRISHDFEDKVFGISLPIYLLLSDEKEDCPCGAKPETPKMNWVGGLRLGWRDDTDEFTAGIFVGRALKIGMKRP